MERTRKLSLKRKRNIIERENNLGADIPTCSNQLDSRTSLSMCSRLASITTNNEQEITQFKSHTVQSDPWQQLPSLPLWTCYKAEETQAPQDGSNGIPSIEIEVTTDVKIQWTPFPSFCKKCMINRPRRTAEHMQKPVTHKQQLNVCPAKAKPNVISNATKLKTMGLPSSEDIYEIKRTKNVTLSDNLSKTRHTYDENLNPPTTNRVSKQSDSANNVQICTMGEDTKQTNTCRNSTIISRNASATVDVLEKSKSGYLVSSLGAGSSGSAGEKISELESSSKDNIAKTFVPFSHLGMVKPGSNNEPKLSMSTERNASNLGTNKGKQSLLTSQVGYIMDFQAGSSRIHESIQDTKKNTNQQDASSASTTAPMHDGKSMEGTTTNTNYLLGLSEEDLIVILSSDDDDEDISLVKSVQTKTKPAWNPSSSKRKNSGRLSQQRQKSSQNGRSKQNKVSSNKLKSKVTSKAPQRTMFDYATNSSSVESTNLALNHQGQSVNIRNAASVQTSTLKISQATGSGSSKSLDTGQSSSGNPRKKDNSPAEEISLQCCPLCQLTFTAGWNQFQIDGHIAACLAESSDDVTW